jgi:hypothetical protein
MIKTRSNFKLCGENIIPKFDRLIALYSFTVVSNQTVFSFLTAHYPQQFFLHLTAHSSFFHSHNQTKQTLNIGDARFMDQ